MHMLETIYKFKSQDIKFKMEICVKQDLEFKMKISCLKVEVLNSKFPQIT